MMKSISDLPTHKSKPAFVKGSIAGVDTIRAVAALWVTFSHGARFPLDALIDKDGGWIQLLAVGLNTMIFNGTMAVVVFFIISGFCIHYPNIRCHHLDIKRFLIRRVIRICIPLVCIIFISASLGDTYAGLLNAILWSVYCEIIYYLIYPVLLLPLFRRVSIGFVILISVFICSGLVFWHAHAVFLWQLGGLTWLYCLPFWLAGTLLAERFHEGAIPKAKDIWLWRLPPLAYGVLATILVAHSPVVIGMVWTMLPFSVYAYHWIGREINHLGCHPSPILEATGRASYSIYLTHTIAIQYASSWISNRLVGWGFILSTVILTATVFYFTVERPSHHLARFLGRRRDNANTI